MNRFQHKFGERFPDDALIISLGSLATRLFLAGFFWAHLYKKFFTMNGFEGWWEALTQRFPAFVPIYVLTVEFACAVFLPLGIKSRWVALYAVPSFIGIVHFWAETGGYWFTNPGAEFPLMWLCLLIVQIILGDGRFALRLR